MLFHPADALGDMGAASGAVLIILAMYHLQRNISDHDQALVFASSDRGERAALCLKKHFDP